MLPRFAPRDDDQAPVILSAAPALSQVEGKSLKASSIMHEILWLRCAPAQDDGWVSVIARVATALSLTQKSTFFDRIAFHCG